MNLDSPELIIEFIGLPPFKAGLAPNRKAAKQRQEQLNSLAKDALVRWQQRSNLGSDTFPWNPMSSQIALSMTYSRSKGENDSANIVGGVCDALQGVLYADDRRVVEIIYREQPAPDASATDRLTIRVSEASRTQVPPQKRLQANPRAPSGGQPSGWEHAIDTAWAGRAKTAGSKIPGPQAASDAAKVLGAPKLSASPYKTLERLVEASPLLKSRWARRENTIVRQ